MFYRRYDKNIVPYFLLGYSIGILKEHDLQVLQRCVQILFNCGENHYNYVITYIVKDTNTNNCENWATF